ncbi:cytochrome c5 family protein [Parahaliea sp. F7430]|uniref:Cytochrome c5 family protein n=1 Tax=Sediminihaliea albiluteola TaxID=2758564 RepID=A0A7W2TXL5_9GAMM|nr:c-type cytochrome [Sediminihaliea albiluteola]MBA6413821.1 cytochrome c5 family protein [Sediminihaliea albiluteola]
MKNLKLLACAVTVIAASYAPASLAEPPMDKYNSSCAVCHATGVAGAPKTGDVAAWQPRLEKGMEQMMQSVNGGLNAMPPKGMCFNCSDEDYQALIEYMSSPAE